LQPGLSSRSLVKILSGVQIILALVGLVLLFTAEFATYQDRYNWTSWTGETVHDTYTHSIMYNANGAMGALAAGFVVLFVFIGLSGFVRIRASSARIAAKYGRWTMILGLLVIVFSIIAGVVVSLTWASEVGSGYEPYAWWLGTDFYSFLIGGFLFMVIGFIGIRMTRVAQEPFPLPPPPPPPPP